MVPTRLHIAQVAPLYFPIPPVRYGGTERLVGHLVDELVRQGHRVTLFASGDSITPAKLVAPLNRALRSAKSSIDPLAAEILMLEEVAKRAHRFDIIHFHIGPYHFPLARRFPVPSITTPYWHLKIPGQDALFREFKDLPFISLSDYQRRPRPWLNWRATIYHGMPVGAFPFQPRSDRYLVFLGRICPEKGVAEAIQIALKARIPLRMAGPIQDQAYFDRRIRPRIDGTRVHYLGPISERSKKSLLSRALALLFPSDWSEAFGVVLIESLACGTPVIAYRNGPVPEIIDHGVTGYLVRNVNEGADAARNIGSLDRKRCRKVWEERFDVTITAQQCVRVYRNVIREFNSARGSL